MENNSPSESPCVRTPTEHEGLPNRRHQIWTYFIRGDKSPGRNSYFQAHCKFCKKLFQYAKPAEMKNHIIKYCPNAPKDIAQQVADSLPNTSSRKRTRTGGKQDRDNDDESNDLAILRALPSFQKVSTSAPGFVVTSSSAAISQQPSFVSSSSTSSHSDAVIVTEPLSTIPSSDVSPLVVTQPSSKLPLQIDDEEEGRSKPKKVFKTTSPIPKKPPSIRIQAFDDTLTSSVSQLSWSNPAILSALIKMIVTCKLPLDIINSKHFLSFCRLLRPNFTLPPISQFLAEFQAEYERLEQSAKQEFLESYCYNSTLCFDTCSSRFSEDLEVITSLKSVENGKSIVWSRLSLLEDDDSSRTFNKEEIVRLLRGIGTEKICATCSDLNHRSEFIPKELGSCFPTIIHLVCSGSLMRSFLQDLMSKSKWLQELTFQICQICTYFKNSKIASTYLESLSSSPRRPFWALKDDWGSFYSCCRSLSASEIPLLSLSTHGSSEGFQLPISITEILSSPNFFGEVSLLCELLKPINFAIHVFQAEDVTLADCVACFVYLGSALERFRHQLDSQTQVIAFMTFNKYWEILLKMEDGLALLAYFLHPKYFTRGLKIGFIRDIKITASKLWYRKGKTKDQSSKLLTEMDEYHSGNGWFKASYPSREPILNWWNRSSALELKELAILLCSARPTTSFISSAFKLTGKNQVHSDGKSWIFSLFHMGSLFDIEESVYRSSFSRVSRNSVRITIDKLQRGSDARSPSDHSKIFDLHSLLPDSQSSLINDDSLCLESLWSHIMVDRDLHVTSSDVVFSSSLSLFKSFQGEFGLLSNLLFGDEVSLSSSEPSFTKPSFDLNEFLSGEGLIQKSE